MLDLGAEVQGPSEELRRLEKPLFEKIIPRLLRPLETGGRKIRPCLVRGDLWYGKASPDAASGNPLMLDASAFWGHDECMHRVDEATPMTDTVIDEVRTMRPARFKFGRPYLRAYHAHQPISAPKEDHDARNALYPM